MLSHMSKKSCPFNYIELHYKNRTRRFGHAVCKIQNVSLLLEVEKIIYIKTKESIKKSKYLSDTNYVDYLY